MHKAIALMLVCFLSSTCVGQESTPPKSLVGFLKPGMLIGVVPYQGSDRITIDIYTEEDHAIAIDAQTLSLEALATKYEKVASQLEQTREDATASLQSRAEELPPGKEYGKVKISLQANQMHLLCKISAIGDDYILVTSSTTPTKRRVLATRFISSIQWRDELVFNWSFPYVDKATSKPKQ